MSKPEKILFSVILNNGNRIEKWAYSKAQFKFLVKQIYGIDIYDSTITALRDLRKFYAIQAKNKSKIYADAQAHELALLSGHKDLD